MRVHVCVCAFSHVYVCRSQRLHGMCLPYSPHYISSRGVALKPLAAGFSSLRMLCLQLSPVQGLQVCLHCHLLGAGIRIPVFTFTEQVHYQVSPPLSLWIHFLKWILLCLETAKLMKSQTSTKKASVIFGLVVTECCQQRETVSYNSSVVADFKSRTIFSCGFQENQKDLNLGNHLRML